jgi:hypothetical protein
VPPSTGAELGTMEARVMDVYRKLPATTTSTPPLREIPTVTAPPAAAGDTNWMLSRDAPRTIVLGGRHAEPWPKTTHTWRS